GGRDNGGGNRARDGGRDNGGGRRRFSADRERQPDAFEAGGNAPSARPGLSSFSSEDRAGYYKQRYDRRPNRDDEQMNAEPERGRREGRDDSRREVRADGRRRRDDRRGAEWENRDGKNGRQEGAGRQESGRRQEGGGRKEWAQGDRRNRKQGGRQEGGRQEWARGGRQERAGRKDSGRRKGGASQQAQKPGLLARILGLFKKK
ncbi:MAG: hypothetical protein LBG74_04615, partial [Spirochaetaceae bacterium]|nr:hypothetical protein [Spirochaetaceae bacterium]